MVHFVGAGPGAEDLITLRGKQLIEQADVIIYAGSLVNPDILNYAAKTCELHDSSRLTLDEVIGIISSAEKEGRTTVRLHTGDPSVYGAIREQMDLLSRAGIRYDVVPGVSSFCGAAAALNMEYTLPGVSQTVIITRMEGRTPVPAGESIEELARHKATMVFFLSAHDTRSLSERLITWEDEQSFICTLKTLHETAAENNIQKTALIIVGEAVLQSGYDRSKLYSPEFTTGYRKGTDNNASKE